MAVGLKSAVVAVDVLSMLVLLALLTVAYAVVVVRICQGRRLARHVGEEHLGAAVPCEDLPPATAVGWPPGGDAFTAYVDEGIAALDAYLSEGYTP